MNNESTGDVASPPSVGFLLLTHDKPRQTQRLVATLNAMFGNPRIVCHHDSGQSAAPEGLPDNVELVIPHVKTAWSEFSLVDATLRALSLAYAGGVGPDWFVLLSGADYPIKPAPRVLADLAATPFDAHIYHTRIAHGQWRNAWERLCHARYCARRIEFAFVGRHLQPVRRSITLEHPLFTFPFVPFGRKLACYAGSQWFCINRKAARYLLDYHAMHPRLADYYRGLDAMKVAADESYVHTVLCNAPGLKVSPNNWRYVDWDAGGRHPKTLDASDYARLVASEAHFARKFDLENDADILERLDRINLANQVLTCSL